MKNDSDLPGPEITLKPFQYDFVFSEERFPALIAGIGTGKTYMLLLKIWNFLSNHPNCLGLICRKEYTDLHDSTMKDFTRYFGVTADSNKEFKFPNGSVLMFRHAAEVEVLKNINLSIFGIEQAEEFETDEQFIFLRDRLRNPNSPYRQGVIIANARGHNWIWKKWVNNPQEGYFSITATTFDNEENLPVDFINDLRKMEQDAPTHYKQYVLNSFEEVDADDLLLTHEQVYGSSKIEMPFVGKPRRIMAVDVARYGGDEIVYCILESRGVIKWEMIHLEGQKNKSLTWTTGKIIDMVKDFDLHAVVIDDTGMGGGVTDALDSSRYGVFPFNGAEASNNPGYLNRRAEGFFKLQEAFQKGWLKILPDTELQEQLLTIKYKYKTKDQKMIVSKDEMRREGLKSPDRADALMMAYFFADRSAEGNHYPDYCAPDEDLYRSVQDLPRWST